MSDNMPSWLREENLATAAAVASNPAVQKAAQNPAVQKAACKLLHHVIYYVTNIITTEDHTLLN